MVHDDGADGPAPGGGRVPGGAPPPGIAHGTAHLRVFQPLAAYPDAVQARLIAGAHRTRAEVEAEAAERARRRLARPVTDPFPEPGEDDLVRVLQDEQGSAFYCPDEFGLRAEMAAAQLEETMLPLAYEAAVPTAARAMNRGRVLVALEEEWGLSPDPDADRAHPDEEDGPGRDEDGPSGRHRVQTRTATWGVPHGWLAVFDPEEPVRRLVDGERTAYRRAPALAALERAGHAAAALSRHAPDAELIAELTVMVEWLGAFHPDSWVELDYGGLTRHVWPDDSVFDLWTLIDALGEGDEATAGVAQGRLNRRWAAVGMLARLT
ncbi:hypothetical protein [Micrococcus endophyticus]|uniref:hypothetical protein n=1 Tax=Micrococcus endophyticus TaxID=455343 RepID=UPI002002CC73